MTEKIYLPSNMVEVGQEALLAAGFEVIIGTGEGDALVPAEAADASGAFVFTQPFDGAVMDQFPKLKVIARNGVGVDNIDLAAATARGIQVVNTPEGNSVTVAETVLACILMLAKNLPENSLAVADGTWVEEVWGAIHPGHELSALTVGLVGFGPIAEALAVRLQALGVRVIANSRHPHEAEGVDFVSLDELLAQSDFVSLHTPGTAQTYHMIDAEALAKMKGSAYLINFARGSVVDTDALVSALQNDEIAGAALDVFETEPLPLDSPLLMLENVYLMPHSGAITVEATNRMALHAAQGIIEVLTDKPVTWPVNDLNK